MLETVRGFNIKHPDFVAWRDTTREILQKFLGTESHHTTRFRDTRFYGHSYIRSDFVGIRRAPGNREAQVAAGAFQDGCAMSEASLRAAIKHVEDFGVYEEPTRPQPVRGAKGDVNQTFHAPVTMNQAIATSSAVQRIGRVGNMTGVDLKEIANLLFQSDHLTLYEVRSGLTDIETLAVEVEKPEEKRNWTAVLECGQRVLDLASKATDLATKLGRHLPTIAALVANAKHLL